MILLADGRVDPGSASDSVLRQACSDHKTGYSRATDSDTYISIVRLLLADHRVDPGERYNNAIREASKNGHVEIVRMLLADYRVDPGEVNNAAVRNVSENGHVEIVRLFLLTNVSTQVTSITTQFEKRVNMDMRRSFSYYWLTNASTHV